MLIRSITFFLLLSNVVFSQAWLQLPDFPGAERDDGVAVCINNKGYFGTGLQPAGASADFYALDLGSLSWSAIAPMPAGAQRQYATVFRGPGGFYVTGGDGAGGFTGSMYRYDIAANAWSSAAPMPGSGLMGMSCMEFGDKIIFAGGKFQNGTVNDAVWEYSMLTDGWQQKGNFLFGGRWRASAATVNGTGYLLFGVDAANRLRKELYAYNQAADTWTKVSDFPLMGRAYATLQSTCNSLIAFSGFDSLNVYHTDVWQFNPAAGSWTQHQSLPSFGRKGGMGITSGNRFYYSCGVTLTARVKETWMLDVPTGMNENNSAGLLSVYPNPVSDMLYLEVESSAGPGDITMLDMAGRRIDAAITKRDQNSMQFSMSGLTPGIYFLQVKSKAGLRVKKIVKEEQ